MNNWKRDRFLTDIVIGCDHEYEPEEVPYGYGPTHTHLVCQKCNKNESDITRFSTWKGFGVLITWLKDQKLWQEIRWNMPMAEFMELVTDPDKAANKVYEYLKR